MRLFAWIGWYGLICVCSLASPSLAAIGEAQHRSLSLAPAVGRLLVATPAMGSNYFRESVILLTAHGRMGSVGVIINRPTVLKVADLLPRSGGRSPVYEGGPVHPHLMSLLVMSPRDGGTSSRKMHGVSFVFGTRQVLERLPLLHHGWRYRLYTGYSGWAPGQLEREIQRGAWYVLESGGAQIFDIHPDLLWLRLIRRLFPLEEP